MNARICKAITACIPALFLLAAGSSRAVCPIYGDLQTTTGHAAQNYSSGMRLGTVELNWGQYETGDGAFSTTYRDQIRAQIASLQSAGLQVVLDFGFQYPPSWIFNLPNSRYINQFGDVYNDPGAGEGGVNAVFNQTMRDKQDAYLQHVFADLGTNFYAVRMGWGWFSEINYPRASYNNHTNSYWAYDAIAQGHTGGLPSGIGVCPVPGWIPGQASTNHASASSFVNWYLDALKNYETWQITTLRKYYSGKGEMLLPGWGVRPGQLTGAINVDLNGTTSVEVNGELQRGTDYDRLVAAISDANIIVYTTWLDTIYGDDNSTDPANWTPVHYLASLAASNPLHLAMSGENTGRNNYAAMQSCFQRAQTYGLLGFMWAFESDLYDTSGAYASLSQYAGLISQYGCGSVPAAPTGLTASAGNAQISLSWNASSGATSYNVLRSTTSGSGYVSVATGITTTSYTNTGLTNGTTYYYVVTAANATGTSGNSAQASATPAAGGSGNTHAGTWAAKAVMTATPSYNNLSQVSTVATNSTYVASFWVKGTGSVLIDIKAGSWGADILTMRCDATSTWTKVTTPSFSTGANTQITVVVQDNYGVAGTVYIDDAFLGVSNGTNMLANPGFESGAVTWGWGGVFTIVQPGGGGTAPAAPTGLTATPGNAQVALSWTASTGATSYNVKRSTISGSGYATVSSPTTTSYTNTGLTNGTTYYYVVTAVNAIGESANSAQVSGTPAGNTHGGTWAAKAVMTATPTYNNLSQVSTVATNSTYVASMWIKGTGSVLIDVKAGSWGADILTMRCDATSTWTKVTTPSFNTGANTQITLVVQDNYGIAGTVYIDDAFLGVSGGANTLANPGFESGAVTWGWGGVFSIVQNP